MNPLLENFISESRDLLEEASQGLLALEKQPDDSEVVNALFRSVHTIKGGSGLFEIAPFTEVVHAAEDVLDAVRNGRLSLSSTMVDLLLDCLDQVSMWIDALEQNETLPEDASDIGRGLAGRQRALLSEGEVEGDEIQTMTVEESAAAISWLDHLPTSVREEAERAAAMGTPWLGVLYTPNEQCFFTGDDPLHTVRQLPEVQWMQVVGRDAWPVPSELDPFHCNLTFHVVSSADEEEIRHRLRYVEEEVVIAPIDTTVVASERGTTASSPSGEHLAGSPGMPPDDVWREILDAQKSLLATCDPAVRNGTFASVATVLSRGLSARGEASLVDAVDEALDAATSKESPDPLDTLIGDLLAHLDPTFAESDGCKQGVEPQGAGPSASGQASPTPNPPAAAPATLKVEPERIDALMDLVGELVVAKNAIPFLARRAEEEYGVRELAREIKQQYAVTHRLAEALQRAVMQIRMVPVATAFGRFPRLVRDLSRKLGKEIHLVVEGEETEADKGVVASLSDPLIHLVRNALDHGIEAPEERIRVGKPPAGTIRLAAIQLDDHVVIEVGDDGRGIDAEAVKRKAYERGIIDEMRLDSISNDEALQLVFAPGLSTMEAVSDLSGRGVGMDVVRTMVTRAGGDIELESQVGKGTTVRLSLPLSMSVSQVMMVEVAGESFGVAIDQVVETVRVPRTEIHRVHHREVVVLRDRLIPLVRLTEVLHIDSEAEGRESEAILVVSVDGREVGLVVDRFHEGLDILLKPLEGVLAGLPTYTGTALLGDGRVLLTLNLQEIARCP